MNETPIKVITFDLDDTFWSVTPVIIKANMLVYNWLQENAPVVTNTFSQQQLSEKLVDYYRKCPDLIHQISKIRMAAMQYCLQQSGYSKKDSEKLSSEAFDIFITARHQVTLFETVEPMLKSLHNKYQLGALTNGNADIFTLSIGKYFDFSFSAEQLNSSKPAEKHFLAAQEYCTCTAAEIIHIGDHLEHDVNAAQQAGCHSVWYNPENLIADKEYTINWQVQSLSELPAIIKKIDS